MADDPFADLPVDEPLTGADSDPFAALPGRTRLDTSGVPQEIGAPAPRPPVLEGLGRQPRPGRTSPTSDPGFYGSEAPPRARTTYDALTGLADPSADDQVPEYSRGNAVTTDPIAEAEPVDPDTGRPRDRTVPQFPQNQRWITDDQGNAVPVQPPRMRTATDALAGLFGRSVAPPAAAGGLWGPGATPQDSQRNPTLGDTMPGATTETVTGDYGEPIEIRPPAGRVAPGVFINPGDLTDQQAGRMAEQTEAGAATRTRENRARELVEQQLTQADPRAIARAGGWQAPQPSANTGRIPGTTYQQPGPSSWTPDPLAQPAQPAAGAERPYPASATEFISQFADLLAQGVLIDSGLESLRPWEVRQDQANLTRRVLAEAGRRVQELSPQQVDDLTTYAARNLPGRWADEFRGEVARLRAGRSTPEQFNTFLDRMTDASNPIRWMREHGEEAVRAFAPDASPQLQREFIGQMVRASGTTVGALLVNYLPAGGWINALSFFSQGEAQVLQDAIQRGATNDQITRLFTEGGGTGGAGGLTEFAELELLLRPVLRNPGAVGFVVASARNMVRNGIGEGLQEAVQQVMQNLEAGRVYDPTRNVWADVSENTEIGAAVGALFGLLATPFGHVRPAPASRRAGVAPGATPPPAGGAAPAPGAPATSPGAGVASGEARPGEGLPEGAVPGETLLPAEPPEITGQLPAGGDLSAGQTDVSTGTPAPTSEPGEAPPSATGEGIGISPPLNPTPAGDMAGSLPGPQATEADTRARRNVAKSGVLNQQTASVTGWRFALEDGQVTQEQADAGLDQLHTWMVEQNRRIDADQPHEQAPPRDLLAPRKSPQSTVSTGTGVPPVAAGPRTEGEQPAATPPSSVLKGRAWTPSEERDILRQRRAEELERRAKNQAPSTPEELAAHRERQQETAAIGEMIKAGQLAPRVEAVAAAMDIEPADAREHLLELARTPHSGVTMIGKTSGKHSFRRTAGPPAQSRSKAGDANRRAMQSAADELGVAYTQDTPDAELHAALDKATAAKAASDDSEAAAAAEVERLERAAIALEAALAQEKPDEAGDIPFEPIGEQPQGVRPAKPASPAEPGDLGAEQAGAAGPEPANAPVGEVGGPAQPAAPAVRERGEQGPDQPGGAPGGPEHPEHSQPAHPAGGRLERPAGYGASNKLVSVDRAEEARAKLRAKFRGQLSAGVDPEIMAEGAILAVHHIEAGARKFADFAREMIADLGEAARPFLRGWYRDARSKRTAALQAALTQSESGASISMSGAVTPEILTETRDDLARQEQALVDGKTLNRHERRVAKKQIEKTKRRLERLAKQAGETAVQASAPPRTSMHAAWHGSPHDHDKFDTGKIGTGEGAQVYGWGLYFAGKRDVAEYYKKALARGVPDEDVRRIFAEHGGDGRLASGTVEDIKHFAARVRSGETTVEEAAKNLGYRSIAMRAYTMEQRQAILRDVASTKRGRLYGVELAPKEEDYLDWDAPLAEQSPQVRAALTKLVKSTNFTDTGDLSQIGGTTGEDFYRRLSRHVADTAWRRLTGKSAHRDDMAASLALAKAGIPGIRYRDAGSRKPPLTPEQRKAFEDRIARANRYIANHRKMVAEYEAEPQTPHRDAIIANLKNQIDAYADGIRMDEEQLREGEDLTRNYVIFDDKHVQIKTKEQRRQDGEEMPEDDNVLMERSIAWDAAALFKPGTEAAKLRQKARDELAPIIARLLGKKIADTMVIGDVLMNTVSNSEIWGGAAPQYEGVHTNEAGERVGTVVDWLLAVSMKTPNKPHTTRHEALHIARRLGIITDAQWAELTTVARSEDWLGKVLEGRYLDETEEVRLEEAIAEVFGQWAEGHAAPEPKSAVGRIYLAFARFMRAIRSWARDFIGRNPSAHDIFQALEDGLLLRQARARGPLTTRNQPGQGTSSSQEPKTPAQTELAGTEKISEREQAEREMEKTGTRKQRTGKKQNDISDLALFDVNARKQGTLFQTPEEGQGPPTAGAPRRTGQQQAQAATVRGMVQRPTAVDAIVRIPFQIFGGINARGEWIPGKALERKATAALTSWKMRPGIPGAAALNGLMERARVGLIDRYGLDESYIARDRQTILEAAGLMRQGSEHARWLADQKITPAEAKTLHKFLVGELVDDTEWRAMFDKYGDRAEAIRAAIDAMGQEAVALGLISRESYERNRGSYLHRVYMKYEAAAAGTPEAKMANRARSARVRFAADEMKGRGLFFHTKVARILGQSRSWWGERAPAELVGQKFRVLDQTRESDAPELDVGQTPTEEIRRRVYVPADLELPGEFANGWIDRGTFEVRSVSRDGQDAVIWRDFTPDERERMGEILDSRYTIAKTFHLLGQDLATGRFFKDIAANDEWSRDSVDDESWVNASDYGSWSGSTGGKAWVKVPEEEIPQTGGKKRWGALAGRFVRAEIWRDLHATQVQRDRSTMGSWWTAILNTWKLNKAIDIATPIPTPSGWTTMGEIREGDTLFDERGQPCRVTGVRDVVRGRPCYRVAFSDGTSVIADDEHWWVTLDRSRDRFGVKRRVTTQEIRETLREPTRGDANHSIAVAGPLATPSAALPILPYVLGLWLGDGDRRSGRITAGRVLAAETRAVLAAVGASCTPGGIDKRNGTQSFSVEGLSTALRRAGYRGQKRIPEIYLRASIRQRRELLCGLMDSDGWITTHGDCGFGNSDEGLIRDVIELLRSLGYKPTLRNLVPVCTSTGKNGLRTWRVNFRAYADEPVFRLEAKRSRLKPRPTQPQRSQSRQIVAVEPVPSVPVRCIEVDSPSHLYLAGEGMVPTHNTARSPVVHINNVMSNVTLMDMHDIRASTLVRALKSIVRGDGIWQRAVEAGVFEGGWASTEMKRNVLEPLLREIEQQQMPSHAVMGPRGWSARVAFMGRYVNSLYNLAKKIDATMLHAYQAEDNVFKLAAFMTREQMGDDPVSAANFAREAFVDYDIRAPWLQAARKTVLPFISYTYRAAPMMAKLVATKPWKVAKYAGIWHLLNALAYLMWPGDEEAERASLRRDQRSWLHPFFAPRLMRLWNDEYGRPMFLDLRNWVPGGNFLDTMQGQSVLPMLAWMNPGGPLMVAAELLLNRQSFTGQDIVNQRIATTGEQAAGLGDYLWKAWLPNAAWIPGSWSFDKVRAAIAGERDRQGRPYTVSEAALSAVGVKLSPQDVGQGFLIQRNQINHEIRDLELQRRNALLDWNRGRMTLAERNARVEDINSRVAERRAEIQRLMGLSRRVPGSTRVPFEPDRGEAP